MATTTLNDDPTTAAPREAASRGGTIRETLLLLGLALVAEACYLWGFTLPYFMPEHYQTPLVDLVRINGAAPTSFNFFAVAWIFSFFAFGVAFARAPARPMRSYLLVLGGAAVVFNLTLLFMYPTGAADLLDYIVRARQLAFYGDNPWLHTPSEPQYQFDPLRPYIGGWAGTTSPYGPMWEILAAGASKLAGADLWSNLILFKGLVIAAYGASCVLVYAILRRVQPDWAVRGLVFFAWNPLLLWETAGNGHNDIVMVAFMLLAFYLATFRDARLLVASAALALAALVKFVPVLLLPPLLALLWRANGPGDKQPDMFARATRVAIGGGLFMLVAVLVYAPFWIGPSTVGALWRQNLFTASIPNVVKDYLIDQFALAPELAMALVRNGALAVTLFIVLLQSALLLLAPAGEGESRLNRRLYSAGYNIFFVYLIFGTLWFQPWYQIWLIGLTPLVARRDYMARTVAVNAGGVANYFVWDFLVIWNNSWGQVVQWTSALAVNLPPLLFTAYQLLTRRAAEPVEQQTTLPVRPATRTATPETSTSPSAIRRSSPAHE